MEVDFGREFVSYCAVVEGRLSEIGWNAVAPNMDGYGSQSGKAVAPTPVLLPGKSHGRRSLVGCNPCGR